MKTSYTRTQSDFKSDNYNRYLLVSATTALSHVWSLISPTGDTGAAIIYTHLTRLNNHPSAACGLPGPGERRGAGSIQTPAGWPRPVSFSPLLNSPGDGGTHSILATLQTPPPVTAEMTGKTRVSWKERTATQPSRKGMQTH